MLLELALLGCFACNLSGAYDGAGDDAAAIFGRACFSGLLPIALLGGSCDRRRMARADGARGGRP